MIEFIELKVLSFTGRNSSFRENFQTLQEWRRNYDVRLSGQRSLSLVEEQLGKNGSHLHNRIIEGACKCCTVVKAHDFFDIETSLAAIAFDLHHALSQLDHSLTQSDILFSCDVLC